MFNMIGINSNFRIIDEHVRNINVKKIQQRTYIRLKAFKGQLLKCQENVAIACQNRNHKKVFPVL